MRLKLGILSIGGFCIFLNLPPSRICASAQNFSFMRVVVPVANIRSEMKDTEISYAHDPLQETQLAFGERVLVREVQGEWARVSAQEQMEFTHNKIWEGYPGWVHRRDIGPASSGGSGLRGVARRRWSAIFSEPRLFSKKQMKIPFGSRVDILREKGSWYEIAAGAGETGWIPRRDVLSDSQLALSSRQPGAAVWKTARCFIGTPYFWGGLSPYARNYKSAVTGVDCSGLTHLSYRAAGIGIPRDSHEQWMRSRKLRRAELQRGDLVFLANAAKPEKVVHVMMYAGGEFLIEGPGTGLKVRRVTFKKKLGRRLARIDYGDQVGEKIVYFGRPVLSSEQDSEGKGK